MPNICDIHKNTLGKYLQENFGDELGRVKQFDKLTPFTNDRFGERIMRERIKAKAQAGYEKYRLPTGETIGKIEGFADAQTRWRSSGNGHLLKSEELKVGSQINSNGQSEWIITDILGDGRFKAVPQSSLRNVMGETVAEKLRTGQLSQLAETFDLTGKSNPQYRRYSNWGKFLKNKLGGKEVTDPQGNTWIEANIKGEKKKAIPAFGGHISLKALFTGAGASALVAPLFIGSKETYNRKDFLEEKLQTLKDTGRWFPDTFEVTPKEQKIPEPTEKNTIGGINFGAYATDPNHMPNIKEIYNEMNRVDTPLIAQHEIDRVSPTSTVKGQDIIDAAEFYEISPKILLSLLRQESKIGITKKAIDNNNPGHILITDEGGVFSYKTMREGVFGAARELSRRKTK